MRRGILLWLLPALAGCSTPGRHTAVTPAPVPDHWQAAKTPGGAVIDNWWTAFGDTNLVAAVQESLTRNQDLQAAAARLDAAGAEARIAGADLTPHVGLGFDASRTKRNFIGFPIPGSTSRVLSSHSTTYGLNLNTSWELDLWGRIRSGKAAALAEVRASLADLNGARNSLAAQTVKAWIAVQEMRRQTELAQATIRSYRTTADQVRARYERGLRSPLDLRLALSSLANAESLLEDRRARLDRLIRQLEILMGRYPAGAAGVAGDLPPVPPAIPAGLPAEILARRPDLAAAEARLRAADSRMAAARASLYPRISLTASGGTSTADLVDLVSSDFGVWTLAANLAQPVFEGGRLRAGVALAEANSRQSVANFKSAALRAFGEVEAALAAEQFLARREQSLASASQQSAAALRLAEDRYYQGLETFTTVLEAQRRALEADSQLLAVRRARLDNRVDLHLALGGGFNPPATEAGRPAATAAETKPNPS